jgi:hypothetical protein
VQARIAGWPESVLILTSPARPKSMMETESHGAIKINIGANQMEVIPKTQQSMLGLQIPTPDPVSDPSREAETTVPNQEIYWTNLVKFMELEINLPLILTKILG